MFRSQLYSGTRSSGTKLIHNISFTNKHRNHYFVRICRLWNALPIIDLNMSIQTIKKHLKIFMWNHFNNNFNSSNIHTFHFICPCSSCLNSPPPTNFSLITCNYIFSLITWILCYVIL